MDGQYRTAADLSNKDDALHAHTSSSAAPATIVWLLKVEDPAHVWVKKPFSPTILRVALATPLDKDDLTYCLRHMGIVPEVQAELTCALGEWRDGAFPIQDAENGRPGMTIRRNRTCVDDDDSSAGLGAAGDDVEGAGRRIPTTMRKRRGFGRTME